MPITQVLNSKANVKKFTNADLPFSPQQPVIASFRATSTLNQTVINLTFSVDQSLTDIFWLFVDGKKLELGSSNDYTFTSIGSDNTSSQVTLRMPLAVGLNIEGFKLGLKKESEFGVDNRFVSLYEAQDQGFQAFINTQNLLTATTTPGAPATGRFYSSIINRASIVDVTQDLKARMGIERLTTQNIYQIQNEFGPNGELVWGALNDNTGQIRFVGAWSNVQGANGQAAAISSTTDYVEVTFYGTGLNILQRLDNSSYDIRATVDGGTEGSNLATASYSSVLQARNYSTNQVYNIVDGLTLGTHTVKIRTNNATNTWLVHGFEVINKNATILNVGFNPGIAYNKGQKYTSAAFQSVAYNAAVTGIRGGRVLSYLNADGTIGQTFQAVNASSATLASADHTNEEVVRRYAPREFGAGRSDDFSLTSASAARAFTLDDDTTTVYSSAAQFNSNAGFEGVTPTSNATDFITFTFVGTGLDIMWNSDGASSSVWTVTVDGTSVGTITGTGTTSPKIQKVVSGLPYGTHTVKFFLTTINSSRNYINAFIVYQPKKPALPAGAIELADYNVMATFVANATAGLETVSTGILRKVSTREFVYVGSGWSTTNDATYVSGVQTATNTTSDYVEFSFFGSGIDGRNTTNTTFGSATVLFDGLALSTTNYSISLNGGAASGTGPSVSVVTYGGNTFTASTGTLAMSGSNTVGSGFIVNAALVGLHKIRLTLSSGLGLRFSTIDVITPIHSVKSNIYADLQNSLTVGSNAISDNRKLTPVKDILPGTKALAQAIGVTSGPTSTTNAFIPCPDMSLTISTKGGPLQISYSLVASNSAATSTSFQVFVNGVAVGTSKQLPGLTGNTATIADLLIVPVPAGTHKVDLYWLVPGNTTTATGILRDLTAREL